MMDDAGRRRRPDWSTLPDLAVVEIATRLNPIQFITLRSVCKSWRSVCLDNKAAIVAKLPPMLLCLNCHRFSDNGEPRTSPACQLYSFPDNTTYVSPLPPEFFDLGDSICGYSHGYIITCKDSDLRFANPFTGDDFSLRVSWTEIVSWTDIVKYAVLSDSPRSPSCDVVLFMSDRIVYCRLCSGEASSPWSTIYFRNLLNGHNVVVLQALWFKGLLYCVGYNKVFAVELQCTPPRAKNFNFGMSRHLQSYCTFPPCILANDNELMLLDLTRVSYATNRSKRPLNLIYVYRLQDPEMGYWEQLDNVGGRTLFSTLFGPQDNGFLPCVAGLAGFEHDWSDCVLFTTPLGCFIADTTAGILYNAKELPSVTNYRWPCHSSFAWASPSLIC